MSDHRLKVRPVPCEHIYAYYQREWEGRKNLYNQFLRRGYYQWSRGLIETMNNLFDGIEA